MRGRKCAIKISAAKAGPVCGSYVAAEAEAATHKDSRFLIHSDHVTGFAKDRGIERRRATAASATLILYLACFFLDTTSAKTQNPGKCFFAARRICARGRKLSGLRLFQGRATCNTCRAGRYSASIRIAWLADTGCAPITRRAIIAATVVRLSATFHPRLAPG